MPDAPDAPARPAGYPARWETDVVLADGAPAHVRPVRPDDAERLVAFHQRQSPESIYLRFFSPRPELPPREVERFTNVDYEDRMALIALLGAEMIGVARYDRYGGGDVAEVAFFVDDRHTGRGLATLLLEHLAAAAQEAGISRFTATCLPQNTSMIGVFRQAGFDVKSRFADGVVEIELGIVPTAEGAARIAERERAAEARSVARLLEPRSVAVIGAGRHRRTLGREVLANLVRAGFEGPVYPVNPSADYVHSVHAYPSVLDVPGPVDLAVLAVPPDQALAAVAECGRKRVGGLVVMTAGFAGGAGPAPAGAPSEEALIEAARLHGMRVLGPNCMGVINTDPAVRLNATFVADSALAGSVAFSTDSGTLGAAILGHMRSVGLGVSHYVALGERADVSSNDLLQYWENDPRVAVICLHTESVGNPRKFHRIARRVSRVKPVLAVTPTDLGREEAPLPASVLLEQSGVVCVERLEELFDAASVLVSQPPPKGPRVAVVSNSAGSARLAAEAARRVGLAPVRVSDLTYRAGPAEYGPALEEAFADPGVDSVVVVYAPPVEAPAAPLLDAVTDAARRARAGGQGKAVVATILGVHPTGAALGLPLFAFPEQAARALGYAARYGERRAQDPGVLPDPAALGVDLERARRLIGAVLGEAAAGPGRWLVEAEAVELLAAGGLTPTPRRVVDGPEEAAAAAEAIGWPVALKAGRRGRLARSELSGLALDLNDAVQLRASWARMQTALGADAMRGALVQAMAPAGFDARVVAVQHPAVGPVVGLGRGGSGAGPADLPALHLAPLSDLDARRLVAGSPIAALLAGSDQPIEAAPLEELLLRVSALTDAAPELAEIRLDPVLVSPRAASITDLAVRVAPFTSDRRPRVRRLDA
ncbi:MAG: GNAT family N-acetyltransferase [Acidimicrobiales bacterium]